MKRMHNKDEIKEVVNQGIESGEIQVGTKLYRHEIQYSSGNFLIFIDNTPSYEKESIYDELEDKDLSNFLSIAYYDDAEVEWSYLITLYIDVNDAIFRIGYWSTGNEQFVNVNIFSDTISDVINEKL